MTDEKISVIISTYYRNELVQDAIESVLQQDYDPVELLVVDDSGEGHAEPVLDQYEQVTPIIRDENGDWEEAYTTGIEASTGEYIHFLDDDDYLLDGKLTKTAEVLRENPVGVAYSGVLTDDGMCHRPKPEVSGDVLAEALRFDTFPCCTITLLMRRDVLMDILPLADPGADNGTGDLNLIIELARRTEFDYVNECLACYRKNESRKWVGTKKFEEMKRIVRRQSDVYDRYPSIRREVLTDLYEREGRVRLDDRLLSARAVMSFLCATYYARDVRFRCAVQAIASIFGRPGLDAARLARDLITDDPSENAEGDDG